MWYHRILPFAILIFCLYIKLDIPFAINLIPTTQQFSQAVSSFYSAPLKSTMASETPNTSIDTPSKVMSPATSTINASGSKNENGFTFLVLAPVSSASYPMHPPVRSPKVEATPAINPAEKWFIPADISSSPIDRSEKTAEVEYILPKTRRSSSVSSSESFGRPRFLKLGPVHFGGEPGVPDFTLLE